MKSISIALTYCTNDHCFLKTCIDHIQPFANEIVVSSCDHYWNGDNENLDLLNQSALENSSANFITFEYNPKLNTMEHNVLSRQIAVSAFDKPTDYILFLDADEIVESDKMTAWWKNQQDNLLDCYKLANYWYFRDFCYQLKTWEDSVCLVKNTPECINSNMFDPRWDRQAFFEKNPTNEKKRMVTYNDKPFIHHYSWVRSKETMLRKVMSWGHNKDRDWVSLVNQEFDQPFRGKDVMFGDREYVTVEPYVNIPIT